MPAGVGYHGNRKISSIWKREKKWLASVFYFGNPSYGLEEFVGSAVRSSAPPVASVAATTDRLRITFRPQGYHLDS